MGWGCVELDPPGLAEKKTVANLWIVSQLEMQSHCPSSLEDLDFFLISICWCPAAWGGDLEAGLGEGSAGISPAALPRGWPLM